MARNSPFRGGPGDWTASFNMTPMIDVTFQLIIFFILASQLASTSLARLDLPKPHQSQAIDLEHEQKVMLPKLIVNVLLDKDSDASGDPMRAGKASIYKINNVEVEVGDVQVLSGMIEQAIAQAGVKAEEFYVEIRADKRVNGSDVGPIFDAAAKAGVAKVNLSALVDNDRQS